MNKLVSCLLASMVAVSLAGCSSSGTASAAATSAPSESAAASAASYKAGTYTGSAEGHNGTVSVDVTFTDDAISSIEIKENSETPTLSDKALKDLPDEIVAQQTLNVDNVSGATFTSMAVKNAVADAVTQAGGDADALRKAPYEKAAEATDDISTDVLVIGGGTAGLMAAYEAGKAGVSTTLIEKLDVLGGTLNEAAGLLLTVDSEKNDSSLDDSLDRVLDFYKTVNADSSIQPDYDFTKNLMSQTGATVDELIDMGLAHNDLDLGTYVGTQFTIGYRLSADLIAAIEKEGVKILTGTAADELVTDSDGAVTGAKVHNDTGSFTISAKKIIVACGGASWNTSMVPEKSTGIDVHEKTQIGSTGDGMNMLQQIGAQMSSEDIYIKSSQPDYADEFHNDWSNTPSNGMALLIDSEGKRFTNEAPATATILNKKMIDHASSSYWFLIDDDNTIGYDDDYFAKVKEFAADDDVKAVVHADSLEELAGKLGVDAGTLKQTVEDYNSACAAGKDDEFGKDAQYLKAYPEDGGFYAVYQRIGSWGTIGGAIVDEQQHVLDADGNVIPNVFAAGETATAQLFGDYYFGGFSLGLYTTAGRIAAEQAVAEIQQ